jgi:hypothetical protein
MMALHSTDAMKKAVMAALKRKTGATKITQVKRLDNGDYTGNCFRRNHTLKYECLGFHSVTQEECDPPSEP